MNKSISNCSIYTNLFIEDTPHDLLEMSLHLVNKISEQVIFEYIITRNESRFESAAEAF